MAWIWGSAAFTPLQRDTAERIEYLRSVDLVSFEASDQGHAPFGLEKNSLIPANDSVFALRKVGPVVAYYKLRAHPAEILRGVEVRGRRKLNIVYKSVVSVPQIDNFGEVI